MIMTQVNELTPELFICLWVEIIRRVHHQARNALIVPHTDLGFSKSSKLAGFTRLSNDSTCDRQATGVELPETSEAAGSLAARLS